MIACPHDTVALKCLCYCYSPIQASLKISALEAAGFDLFAPWYHTLSNIQHCALALGGLPLLVPHSQAADAMALLQMIEDAEETAESDPPVPRSMPRKLSWRLVLGALLYGARLAPTLNLTFMATDRNSPPPSEGRGKRMS